MTQKDRKTIEIIFGKIRLIEKIRTNILFVRPYGNITIPDISFRNDLKFCVTRMPDKSFYEKAYWACYGPKPSDSDPNAFLVPIVTKPCANNVIDNWAMVNEGDFLTTESGVIVLDVLSLWAWEGYELPNKRDYTFDRRRLETSATTLKTLPAKSK